MSDTEQIAFERLAALPEGMLACPDTGAAVRVEARQLVRAEDGHCFESIEGMPALLPADFVFTEELQHEDQFYEDDRPLESYPPSHRLAHSHARAPIAEACEAAGINAESWILNVGAGPGAQDLGILRGFTENIVCIDISPKAVRRFVELEPLPCLLATAEALPFGEGTMDAVVLSGVLHHVAGHSDMQPYLRTALRVLKPGGTLIALDPNLLYPTAPLMAAIDVVAQRIKPGWRHHVPHERPLVPARLRREIRAAGFEEAQLIGTSFVHNKFPWPLAKSLDAATTALAKRPGFRHFGYWIACTARKA